MRVLALAAAMLLPASVLHAATLPVSNETELNAALASAAESGDTISVLADIVVTGTKTLSKNLTIEGNGYAISVPQPGLDAAGISNPSASPFGVFRTISGTPVSVTIRNLSITGGNATGAGIDNAVGSTLTLIGVALTNNRNAASGGGGIRNGGTMYLNRCRL